MSRVHKVVPFAAVPSAGLFYYHGVPEARRLGKGKFLGNVRPFSLRAST